MIEQLPKPLTVFLNEKKEKKIKKAESSRESDLAVVKYINRCYYNIFDFYCYCVRIRIKFFCYTSSIATATDRSVSARHFVKNESKRTS